jgi:AcrR family transcriptional regulator
MTASSRSVLFGDVDLGGHLHICALFDGPEQAQPVLRSFVRDGIDQGDRVIHIVENPAEALEVAGRSLLLSGAVQAGQLAIHSWAEMYVRDGRFVAADMARFIGDVLAESDGLGFPATRAIGDMEWAQDGVPGVEDLAAYERQVDTIAAPPHAIVCAYDMRRHTASRIAAVVAAHSVIYRDGRLERPEAFAGRSEPRDRIMAAASGLFAERGIRATGVDMLIKEAGVAKATFYRNFAAKDDLIVAWLADRRTRWFDRVRTRAEMRASSPAELIPEVFGAVADWLEAGNYTGCPYLNTASEITDPSHRAVRLIRDYLGEIEAFLQRAVREAGYRDWERLGSSLYTLLAGSISLAAAHRTSAFALAARAAAERLLETEPLTR